MVDENENGLSDFWEARYHDGDLVPGSFDPQADPDSDGWNNSQESSAGTDPYDPNPPEGYLRPVITHTHSAWLDPDYPEGEPLVTGMVHVTWPTLPGKRYTLLASGDLTPQSWLQAGPPFTGSGSTVTQHFLTDDSENAFYRVSVSDTDTDNDDLTDAEEQEIGSSPYLPDTNDNGIPDRAELAAGGNPSATTPDGNADGSPDSEIYSIVIESLSESKNLTKPSWHKALTGVDEGKRYLTKVVSETYSISDSPRYGTVADGVHRVSETCKNESGGLETQPQKIEGTNFDGWRNAHAIALAQGESIDWEAAEATTVTTPPTATVTTTTTTTGRSWKVMKDDIAIRNGVEIIEVTDRVEVSDSITVQGLWSKFGSLSWEEDSDGWKRFGPPDGISPGSMDVGTAESIRNDYRANKSPLFDWLSWPEQNVGSCGDRRMKAMRWRWVKFNPRDPGEYDYSAPPAGYSRSYHFLVMRWDRDFKTGEWPDAGQGLVELRCDGGIAGSGWQDVDMAKFLPFRKQDPWKLSTMDFTSGGNTQIFIQGVEAGLQKRMAIIADDGGATTYRYEPVSAVPREVPLPNVEIFQKSLVGDRIIVSAKIYDPVSDVLGSGVPQAWVNSRSVALQAGDKPGVSRLLGHSYKLYPGRNEISIAVENPVGARASETLVVEGDDTGGYSLIGESVRIPERPTYPIVFAAPGEDATEVTVTAGSKSARPGFEYLFPGGAFGEAWYRTKPFLSIMKPPSATAAAIASIPAEAPLFITELEDDVTVSASFPGVAAPSALVLPQSGVELLTPSAVEVLETVDPQPVLSFKARRMGTVPVVTAALTTYRGQETIYDAGSEILAAYTNAFQAVSAGSGSPVVSFAVMGLPYREGYGGLEFAFGGSPFYNHQGRHDSFRFPAPEHPGVRVFSANWKRDVVLEGVAGRPRDIWYPVGQTDSLPDFAAALASSGCHIVGMTDVSGCFDDAALKRSFLVHGPPGRTFQAFDRLYAAQGREQRSQTFAADGTHGTALASELGRVQTDTELPASARNALGVEIARTYQFHNGFEDFVPKTHQAYVDPGDGVPQPNSWTMRGSSLPDHVQSNPTPWTVTNTLGKPSHAASASGIVKLDTTDENTAYYATTSATAPWDLTGARAVRLRFKLLEHDAANGADGAFQLAAGDGIRTWTCQVAPAQVSIQGIGIALPAAMFPAGLIDGKFHTLQFNFSGTGDDAQVSIDGEILTSTATSQPGALNGIAFGDPGPRIAGKFETETLHFENSDLRYQYGINDSDAYADSDEIDEINNVLLYLRSKGQAFHTSAIAKWVKILDPRVYEWLLETYTGETRDGSEQELHILANKDVWIGSIVSLDASTDVGSPFDLFDSKITNTLVLDKEVTKVWSGDEVRNEMQLAGILMGWTYQQPAYKEWLAEEEGGGTGIDGILMEKKHLVENIAKCAKNVETTLEIGGEIAISITNEYADYAITINAMRQGDYMAMVGFIPIVPSSTARAFKFVNKIDGTLIEGLDRLCKKFPDFPVQPVSHIDQNLISRKLSVVNLFAHHSDPVAVEKMRKLATNQQMSAHGPGLRGGHELLSTFSNQAVICYKTKEPMKAYRIFDSNETEFIPSNFLTLEIPISKSQVEADYALGAVASGSFQPNYDSWIEIEIPAGSYVFTGVAGPMDGKYVGGGRQVWIEDDVVNGGGIDWGNQVANSLPPN